MKKVGIIGNGFVGEAIAFAFSSSHETKVYDIDKNKATHPIDEVLKCDLIFVCVPTPMFRNGRQDLSFIENVFKNATKGPLYVIKSTVLPGTTENLINKYDLDIIFSPEFLTERTAKLDMLTQSRIILGGNNKLTKIAKEFFEKRFKNKNIIQTDSTTAEFIKYMNNIFFATKVSVMNEFKLISEKIGANWDDAIFGFASDGRVGDSHLNVPGHDGKLGYGGTCFPKDVSSLIQFAKDNKINIHTIEGGWKTNLELRPEKDWENKIGRAVSD